MERLTNKESSFLILLFTINPVILITSQVIVEECSSGSLLNALFVSVLAIAFTGIICLLFKKFRGLNILDIAEFVGGKFLKTIIAFIFFLYFIYTVVILLYKLIDCLQVVYYSMTNPFYIALLFIIGAGVICSLSHNAVFKANLFFLPISAIVITSIFIGNTKNLDFTHIYPILGNGVDSLFLSGITNIFSFGGIALLYFLPSKMKEPSKFTKVAIVSIFLASILFIICVAIVLLMFNTKLISGQLFPMYLAVRYIEFGKFFQRLDSVFLLFRIISFVGFLSANVIICQDMFKNVTNASDIKPILSPLLLLIFAITFLICSNSNLPLLQNTVYKIIFFSVVIGVGFIILLVANIKKKFFVKLQKEEQINE